MYNEEAKKEERLEILRYLCQ